MYTLFVYVYTSVFMYVCVFLLRGPWRKAFVVEEEGLDEERQAGTLVVQKSQVAVLVKDSLSNHVQMATIVCI